MAALETVVVDGAEHVGIRRTEAGRSAVEVLSGLLGTVVSELRAEKNMRWRAAGLSYARPVRWLLALLGETPLPVVVSSLSAGVTTRVFRTAPQPVVPVPHAAGYAEFLAGHGIVLDTADRRAQIIAAAGDLAASVGGVIDADGEAALLDQIAALVEAPNAVLGSFDAKYLDVPEAILTTVMRKHQRYLPVTSAETGALLPYFIAVANGACDVDVVRAGNQAVLRARYEDAAFFFRADQRRSPADLKQGLGKLTFAEGLGSMADRAARIAAVADDLAGTAELSAADTATLRRAGELAKFDLASQMVVELSSLAGTMAQEYAARAGETPEVATALADMERPRSAGGQLPETCPGAVLALADRFDLLAGLFGTGARPTGSSDPFGLRRAALGAITILRDRPDLRAVTVGAGLAAAAKALAAQQVEVPQASLAEAAEFTVRRYEQALLDAGHEFSLVQAVLPLADVPAAADAALADLERLVGDPDFAALAAALQRCRRIVPADVAGSYDPAVLTEPAELALDEAVAGVRGRLAGAEHRADSVAGFVAAAGELTGPINDFFDKVMVMADDPAVRAARLGLLASVSELAAGLVDWSALDV